jgi:hypothetical protein
MFTVGAVSLWPVPAVVLAGLWFTASRMVQSGRRARAKRQPPASQPQVAVKGAAHAVVPTSTLRWISLSEFMNLLVTFKDLIVIDLRDDPHAAPVPAAEFVLAVKVHDLVEVLELVPADKVVVFYGVSDLSLLLIETSHFMHRPAPAYVLDERIAFLEVA